MSRTDPLPLGLALLLMGIGVAAVTLMSLSADDVTYARSQWTALLSLVLATPAIALYVLDDSPPRIWWRSFWTVGLAVYLLHFWWTVFRSYNGDFDAIITRQGFVAYTNFAVTIVWTLDVVLAWAAPGSASAALRILLRFLSWASVTVSFLAAAVVFRSGLIAEVGIAVAAILVVALLLRYLGLVHWVNQSRRNTIR